MKKSFLLLLIVLFQFSFCQVGINTDTPNSTLSINGSLQAGYKEISGSYNLTSTDYYITYNGTSEATVILPVVQTGNTSFTGRIYKIKNISGFSIDLVTNDSNLRIDGQISKSITIKPGSYVEIVNNNNLTSGWDVSFLGANNINQVINNVQIYGTQLKIPPHSRFIADFSNHSNTTYDTTDWFVISKSSSSFEYQGAYSKSSRMIIIYEYQGDPMDITNLYPILTTGNDQSYPDIFVASFIKLTNDGTNGKTRLTVSVSRSDFVGTDQTTTTSNWQGTFLLNVLLAKLK
ncbi:hypothetical protein [Apibacter sp. HY039]|uniref:hypothetical protein n=1 Tax=Apibacter sp. HY039 TaxID=2501476 RepID=UPI000FEC1AD8|nr:hypothetical protein [Apibacter sp. HY039]